MKSATVADLRNHFRHVSSWIENGETVTILKRGHPFAQLSPPVPTKHTLKKPDMMGQLKKIWGKRVLSSHEVKAMRQVELEGEEG